MSDKASIKKVLDVSIEGLSSWFSTESQLHRVLHALINVIETLPVYLRTDLDGQGDAISPVITDQVRTSCIVKNVFEVERLLAYLLPLMSQLKQSVGHIESAVAAAGPTSMAGGKMDQGAWLEGFEASMSNRTILSMLSKELWRKQALAAALTKVFEGVEDDPSSWDVAYIRHLVTTCWPLGGTQSFFDVSLVKDIVSSSSQRNHHVLQELQDLIGEGG